MTFRVHLMGYIGSPLFKICVVCMFYLKRKGKIENKIRSEIP